MFLEHLVEEKQLKGFTPKEKSAFAVKQLQSIVEQRGMLKWNRKPSKTEEILGLLEWADSRGTGFF